VAGGACVSTFFVETYPPLATLRPPSPSRGTLSIASSEAAFIALDNPAAAARLVNTVARTVELLARHLGLGRPGRLEGTRELVVANTPYLVPYRVRNNVVEILRVFHGARKWPEKF
jgi:toxin ParE1/3/4